MMKVLKKKRKGGFTLIELIVVIAILGILAAIAIPRLGGFTDSAQIRADEANAKMLENAAAVYQAGTGSYPATLAALLVAVPGEYTVAIEAVPALEWDGWAEANFEAAYTVATGQVTLTEAP